MLAFLRKILVFEKNGLKGGVIAFRTRKAQKVFAGASREA